MTGARTAALAALAMATVFGPSARADNTCTNDAMIVFDGSGSMAEMGFNLIDEPRIFEARRALADVLPEIAVQRRLGLLIYGPGGADTCSGVDLRFAPVENAAARITNAVEALQPTGDTALTVAVDTAAELLLERQSGGTVLLVTDGKETCGGAPCALAAELSGKDITVHVIGFKVRGEFFAWGEQAGEEYRNSETVARCLADRTGGLYVGAETVQDLIAAFRKTLGCKVLF
ncbi:MAG: VWA domain-containing protein [Pseudomonadota bacterium]